MKTMNKTLSKGTQSVENPHDTIEISQHKDFLSQQYRLEIELSNQLHQSDDFETTNFIKI